ncbi:AAA family ATPase [Aestuariispira insulae]|uniref:ATPase family protein associated with various cellular activities (AAA) n=1 Tax=Aestuariispira insulae TaxID=1461337 RepID=A0A3D9HXN6_9PROT|nr:ATP-binding protein [Aestuariispira insulae]RED54179.1 ATPase family protein associated with various cellular activities (AAA) [Aestuariispira insulae]
MTAKNLVEIREDDVHEHYETAYGLLKSAAFAGETGKAGETGSDGGYPFRRLRSPVAGMPNRTSSGGSRDVTANLLETISGLEAEDPLHSEVQNHVLRVLRRGTALALAMNDMYGKATGLDRLKDTNKLGRLTDAERTDYRARLSSAAAISGFTLCAFARHQLTDYLPDSKSVQVQVNHPDGISLATPIETLETVLGALDGAIRKAAKDDVTLVRVVEDFLLKVADDIRMRRDGLKGLDQFEGSCYRLEADKFEIQGFRVAENKGQAPLTMAFKKPEEVIGNHVAKHQMMKLAKMLMAYDFTRQMNPFAELGGFVFTFMGDGKPGTGKTTLIQMAAGLMSGYCENAGYPFVYQNFSIDQIDSYQGKSGQNARDFVRAVLDPTVIGFGTIDDIDQIAGKRGDKQSSAGQQEVTAVLMESFAGANTVVRGNCTFGMFSNYPENVDDALRQRAGGRYLVDGPQDREDYIDILALLLGKNHDIPVGEHNLYENQVLKKAVEKSYAQHAKPQEAKLSDVFETVRGQVGELDTLAKMGTYLNAIREADERFTGRAIKNITDAVKIRSMDVELPDEWMENPDLFMRQDYDRKLAMIKEMMVPITPEMVIQEINRYADSEFRYGASSDDAAVSQMVRDMGLRDRAARQYAGNHNSDGV